MNTMISTALVMSITSGVLALILSISNKTLNTFGRVKITVNNETDHVVEGGETLMESLRRCGVQINSACGGKGTCRTCKVVVLSGGGEILPTEKSALSEDDLINGYRLACQVRVFSDISVLIPESLMNIKQYECAVTKIEDLTQNIKLVRLRMPEDNDFGFRPGQYIQFYAPEYPGNDEPVHRNYSIASSNRQNEYIDLYVRHVPNGICSTYIHQHLKVGDTALISGPYGEFSYHDSDKKMLMICTGCGFAPIRSILEYMRDNEINRQAALIYGARTEPDVYDRHYFDEFSEFIDDLTVCISSPNSPKTWQGKVGWVTDFIKDKIDNPLDVEVYICGSEKMVNSATDVLVKIGVPMENIYFDRF